MAEIPANVAQYSCKIAGKTFQVLELHGYEEISRAVPVLADPVARRPRGRHRAHGPQGRRDQGRLGRQGEGVPAASSPSSPRPRAGKPGLGGVDAGVRRVHGRGRAHARGCSATRRNCRIFQEMTADQIIKKVLDERGMAGKYERQAAAPTRSASTACSTARPTSRSSRRLMEEEGIFYYFTHDGKEMMVLGDSTGHYGTCAPGGRASSTRPATGELVAPPRSTSPSLTYEESAYTGKVKLQGLRLPRPDEAAARSSRRPTSTPTSRSTTTTSSATATTAAAGPSPRCAVEAPRPRMEQDPDRLGQLALGQRRAASLTLSQGLPRRPQRGVGGGVGEPHAPPRRPTRASSTRVSLDGDPARATRVPAAARAPRKPTLNPQTATVVGPPGEKIYMDELGRAKVQFHWDLDGHERRGQLVLDPGRPAVRRHRRGDPEEARLPVAPPDRRRGRGRLPRGRPRQPAHRRAASTTASTRRSSSPRSWSAAAS